MQCKVYRPVREDLNECATVSLSEKWMTILWNTSPKYHQHMLAYSSELMCFLPPLVVLQALLPKIPANDLHPCSLKPLRKGTVKNFQAICWQLPWAINPSQHSQIISKTLRSRLATWTALLIYNLRWWTSMRISNDLGPINHLKSLPPNDQSKCLAAVSASRQLSTSNDCCRAEESWSCLVATTNSGWQAFVVPVQ